MVKMDSVTFQNLELPLSIFELLSITTSNFDHLTIRVNGQMNPVTFQNLELLPQYF
jgi:hypothetical protein